MKDSHSKRKKSLSQILASYYQDKKSLDQIKEKEVLQKAYEEMHEAKKSFHSFMQLQQELAQAYKELHSKLK